MPFQPHFQFVQETGTAGAKDQSLVKTHAQRQAWRKRRKAAVDRLKRTEDQHGLSNTLSLSLEDRTHTSNSALVTITASSLGHGNSDPFESSAINITPTLNSYLIYFATSMWTTYSSECQPNQFLTTFGRLAVQEGGLLYAIAASSAARRSSKAKTLSLASDMQVAHQHELLYTTLTSEMIRKSMNQNSTSESEITIGLIAFLAMLEAVDLGRLSRAHMHIAAIRNMIEARGGSSTVSLLWYERILAADVKTACVGLTRPMLPILDIVHSTQQIRDALVGVRPRSTSHFKNESVARFLTPFCQDILENIQDLVLYNQSHTYNTKQFDSRQIPESSPFLYHRLALEQVLLCHIADAYVQVSALEECIRIGLLLFINTAFWTNFDSSCAILSNLCVHLRQRWSNVNSLGMNTSAAYSGIAVWLLFLGAHASRGTDSYAWFVQQIRRETSSYASISDEAGLKQALLHYLYVDQVYADTLYEVSLMVFE